MSGNSTSFGHTAILVVNAVLPAFSMTHFGASPPGLHRRGGDVAPLSLGPEHRVQRVLDFGPVILGGTDPDPELTRRYGAQLWRIQKKLYAVDSDEGEQVRGKRARPLYSRQGRDATRTGLT